MSIYDQPPSPDQINKLDQESIGIIHGANRPRLSIRGASTIFGLAFSSLVAATLLLMVIDDINYGLNLDLGEFNLGGPGSFFSHMPWLAIGLFFGFLSLAYWLSRIVNDTVGGRLFPSYQNRTLFPLIILLLTTLSIGGVLSTTGIDNNVSSIGILEQLKSYQQFASSHILSGTVQEIGLDSFTIVDDDGDVYEVAITPEVSNSIGESGIKIGTRVSVYIEGEIPAKDNKDSDPASDSPSKDTPVVVVLPIVIPPIDTPPVIRPEPIPVPGDPEPSPEPTSPEPSPEPTSPEPSPEPTSPEPSPGISPIPVSGDLAAKTSVYGSFNYYQWSHYMDRSAPQRSPWHMNVIGPFSLNFEAGVKSSGDNYTAFKASVIKGSVAQARQHKAYPNTARLYNSVPLSFGGLIGVETDGTRTSQTSANKVGTSLLKTIKGDHDKGYKDLAARMVADGNDDAIVRLGWEYNGTWYSWSVFGKPEGSQFGGRTNATLYRDAYRHVVTLMRKQAGQKFLFDWNGAGDRFAVYKTETEQAYPGNAYVDIVSVDSYGDYNLYKSRTELQAYSQKVKPQMDLYYNFASDHGKLFSLPEWGVRNYKIKREVGAATCSTIECGDLPQHIRNVYRYVDSIPHKSAKGNAGAKLFANIYFNRIEGKFSKPVQLTAQGKDARLIQNYSDKALQLPDPFGFPTEGARSYYKVNFKNSAAMFRDCFYRESCL